MQTVNINGSNLTIEDIWSVAFGKAITEISLEAKKNVQKSQDFLNSFSPNKVIYGVNTGFGPMANYILGSSQANDLQYNLIRSHAVGLGLSLSEETIIAIMVVRLNTLLKGGSAVSWELLERLQLYINKRIIPEIPQHGSVGASGDLVQLAHIALGLIGEGWGFYNGKKQRISTILKELNIEPYQLKSREGLALINGTSAMSGIGALLCMKAKRQYKLAVAASAMALEIVQGYADEYDEFLGKVRPHMGQIKVSEDLRDLISDSRLVQTRERLQDSIKMDNGDVVQIDRPVQDVYSIRCVPQIIGPIYETIKHVVEVLEIEINSITDNPIADPENKKFVHGGNFHGDYVSLEMDKLKIVLSRLAMLAERQINFFLNYKVNNFLPPFLNLDKPGLTLGLQGLQFTATSTAAEIQTLCYPNYVHSIPTNADNQDIVSMGTNSAIIAAQVVNGLFHIQTILYITLCQAIDVLKVQDLLSTNSKSIYKQVRETFPKVVKDRDLTKELPVINNLVEKNLVTQIKF